MAHVLRKILTLLVYHVFNFLRLNRVQYHYSLIKSNVKVSDGELDKLLQDFKCNPELIRNQPRTKEHILEYTLSLSRKGIHEWAYTGGSTGEPLRIPYSKERSCIRTATFRYFNEQAGYKLGDPFVLIRAKNKSAFIKYIRNETVFIPFDISIEKLDYLWELINRNRIKVLMGYPTVIYELATYVSNNRKPVTGCALRAIIFVSEPLPDFQKEFIANVFQCNVIDRYSNEEVGVIAQQKEFKGEYWVNQYNLIVEVVDDFNLPVKEGEVGRVLVTDVSNRLAPFVRYDTGDYAIAHRYEGDRLISIRNILGRKSEQIFSARGNPVSPLVLGPCIYKPLADFGLATQYQLSQEGDKEYSLKIKCEGKLDDRLVYTITSQLQLILGTEAEITYESVDDIPFQSSGKRFIFKNNYHKNLM